jgi:hypothetical protein
MKLHKPSKGGFEMKFNKYVSNELIEELPQPLINFLWYIWEVHFKNAEETKFLLETSDNGLRIAIPALDKTIEQDFGVAVSATIIIRKGKSWRKNRSKYYMSRQ